MVKKVVQVDIQSKGSKKLDKDLESIEKNLKDIDKQADKTFDGENLKKFQIYLLLEMVILLLLRMQKK